MPRITRTTVGSSRNSDNGVETPLDLEVIVAAAPRLERISLFTAATEETAIDFTSSLVQALSLAFGHRGERPDAMSLSLGVCEATAGLFLGTGTLTALHAVNDLFALAGASGISVLASAGDNGSAGCARAASTAVPIAEFPASSPWATAVGGTNLELDAQNRIKRELAWNDTPAFVAAAKEQGIAVTGDLGIGGGGGRSLIFERPWYQRAPGLATDRGAPRTLPDVAALADIAPGYTIHCTTPACADQQIRGWGTVGGTSAASPLLAASVALMNQDARRRGQRPLGFLNPLIYQLANSSRRGALFNDVKVGTNDVSAAMPELTFLGGAPAGIYPAVPGYDFASGWGSPKLAAFDAAALRAGAAASAWQVLAGGRGRSRRSRSRPASRW